jgi:signal peptidase II
MRLGLLVAALVIAFDQASKWWVVEQVMRPFGVDQTPFFTYDRIIVTPFFDLVMAWNRGISFGLANNHDSDWAPLVLSGLALVIVAAMLVWLRRAGTLVSRLAVGGIIGGALGNVIDRLRFGAVADFLDLHVAGYHWPAFNLADSAITVGAVVLVVDSLFAGRDSTKKEAP